MEIICVFCEVTSHLLGQAETNSVANLKQRLHSQDMLLSLNFHSHHCVHYVCMLKKQLCDLEDTQLRSGPFCSAVATQHFRMSWATVLCSSVGQLRTIETCSCCQLF